MKLVQEFYSKLDSDKIKINWNKNPIPMETFLSFLTVEVVRSYDHLGSITGWTLLQNESLKLKIGGGVVNGIEYLDTIQYGKNLSNPYNNYINPFFIFDILTEDGKIFFIDYYEVEINRVKSDVENNIRSVKSQLSKLENLLDDIKVEINSLSPSLTTK